jgi:hypothetical protein
MTRTSQSKNRWTQVAAAVALALFGACGPIEYVNRVTQHASESVDLAAREKANELSPYWWTRATLYLHKAREEAAHAGYAAANRFGRIAGEAAERASEEAAGNRAKATKSEAKPAKATSGAAQ